MNDQDQDPKYVLYVEDHPVNSLLMQALFDRRPGLKLVVADSGQAAWRIAQTLQPRLLLLDLGLPDCHGSQLLQLLRTLPACQDVPAIAVTAEQEFDIAGTGFVEIWSKPLDLAQVLDRLDALLADKSTRSPAEAGLHRGPGGPPAIAMRAAMN